MFIQIKSIYDVFSLIVLVVIVYFLVFFDVTVITGSLVCVFLQHFIKTLTTGMYPDIFKRPDGATDCSLFNTGGLVDQNSGFPSGHVAIISFIMNFLNFKKRNIIYNIPIILVAISRYVKKCHNMIQISAGYLLGYGIAYIFFKNDAKIKRYFDKILKKYLG